MKGKEDITKKTRKKGTDKREQRRTASQIWHKVRKQERKTEEETVNSKSRKDNGCGVATSDVFSLAVLSIGPK